jgi:hypothetical protein
MIIIIIHRRRRQVRGLPLDASAGQPQFSPDGRRLVFVSWAHDRRRVGVIYYNTRPSALRCVDITQQCAVDPNDAPKAKRQKTEDAAKDKKAAEEEEEVDR